MRISDWSSDVCSSDLLRRGVSLLWLSVRAQWQPFLVSVTGAALYAALVVGATIVLGRVTDDLIVPAFDGGEVSHGAVVGGVRSEERRVGNGGVSTFRFGRCR